MLMPPLRCRLLLAVALAACGPSGKGEDDDDDDSADATAAVDARRWVDAGPTVDGSPYGCGALPVTVRDFSFEHPDFEHFTSDEVTTGIVEVDLGADSTPTYAPAGPTICTTGAAEFAHWYHDVPAVNHTIATWIELEEVSPGRYVYDSATFFPVDGQGFGNQGWDHNFAFTTQIHTSFEYQGGESFAFRGDDDLWLFINGRLAIDLGGLHQPADATIALDTLAATLAITPGNSYSMDIFHAERHTDASNFRIETTIDCFVVP